MIKETGNQPLSELGQRILEMKTEYYGRVIVPGLEKLKQFAGNSFSFEDFNKDVWGGTGKIDMIPLKPEDVVLSRLDRKCVSEPEIRLSRLKEYTKNSEVFDGYNPNMYRNRPEYVDYKTLIQNIDYISMKLDEKQNIILTSEILPYEYRTDRHSVYLKKKVISVKSNSEGKVTQEIYWFFSDVRSQQKGQTEKIISNGHEVGYKPSGKIHNPVLYWPVIGSQHFKRM